MVRMTLFIYTLLCESAQGELSLFSLVLCSVEMDVGLSMMGVQTFKFVLTFKMATLRFEIGG